MLAQTRKKVLEQLGEDHHVLVPSRVPYSDMCICRERVARNQPRIQPEGGPRQEPAENFASPANLSEIIDIHGLSSPTAMSNAGFDWQEWDAAVGASMGFVS